jgi:hypothetical protein
MARAIKIEYEEEEEVLHTTPALEALARQAREEYYAGLTVSLRDLMRELEDDKDVDDE